MKIAEIKTLVDFCREEGILEIERDGIRLKLAPQKPQKEAPQPPKASVEEIRDPLFNLTAEERKDLFNE